MQPPGYGHGAERGQSSSSSVFRTPGLLTHVAAVRRVPHTVHATLLHTAYRPGLGLITPELMSS